MTPADRITPADRAARDRIETDLASTLFVEAGAGSGKTTALVRRVLALVESGVAIDAIATITFTEKAALELRSRLRAALADSQARRSSSGARAARPCGYRNASRFCRAGS